ncbi:MAG: hypothetical protein JKY65_14245 [Planctomycetes bacterium]|nr:hypothetical protein [Planctomycetota bacterium]
MKRLLTLALLCSLSLALGCNSGSRSRKGASTAPPATSAPVTTALTTARTASASFPEIQGVRWPGAQAGETINVWGKNFPANTPILIRFTGGAVATATWRSERQVTFSVPSGAQTGTIELAAGGQVSNAFPFVRWGQPATTVDDHGDTAATATPMSLAQPLSGRVDFARDGDYFSVALTAGQAYWIHTRELKAAMHTQIELFDAAGASLGLNKRADNLGWGAAILYTPAATDTYYLKVSHWRWTATTGEYQVLIRDAALPRYVAGTENTAPQPLTITTPTTPQSGEVTISFQASDLDGDDLHVMLSYRVYSAMATEFLPASVSPSTPTSGLQTTIAGPITYALTWDSRADVGAASGRYELQVQLSDGKIVSHLRTTAAFDLNNTPGPGGTSAAVSVTTTANAAPVMVSISTPRAAQSGAIGFPYTVSDGESDPVEIEAFYMLDAVSGYKRATIHVTSDPVLNVATDPNGQRYLLVWDSAADTGAVQNQPVVFQLRARDATGISFGRASGSFRVTN